jgi:hypothetical protein
MSTWSDQSDALLSQCVSSFGMLINYKRGLAAPFDVTSIFGHPNQSDTAVDGTGITLDVRVADFIGTAADPVPTQGDLVLVGGFIYTIYLVQVDSEGAGTLYASKTVANQTGGLTSFP